MGLAFLKAQAWHEAGKKYPAPDADWIEAQRLVFLGLAPATPPKPAPAKQPVTKSEKTIVASSAAAAGAATVQYGLWIGIGVTALLLVSAFLYFKFIRK